MTAVLPPPIEVTIPASRVRNGVTAREDLYFGFYPADPFAIYLSCSRFGWTVDRDLIRAGLVSAAGEGEVRLVPRGDYVRIQGFTPGPTVEVATFRVGTSDLVRFMQLVEARVPQENVDYPVGKAHPWVATDLENWLHYALSGAV